MNDDSTIISKRPRWSFRPFKRIRQDDRTAEEAPLRSELFSVEQLKSHARTLAGWHKFATRRSADRLLPRLDENEAIIHLAHDKVAAAVARGRRISPASEWLVDNFYLIQEQILTTRLHLPRHYSRELPQLAAGPGQGLPRVYHIALELIAHLDGRVDSESLSSFIASYQLTAPLMIGELWAIPIMLRLALFENIRRVAARISRGRDEFDLSDTWADRLIDAAENKPAKLIVVLADMAKSNPELTHGFVAEMSRRLQGRNPGLAVPLSWIEQRLSEQSQSLEECIQLETQNQAANQVSIGNCIGSIRALAAIDWREFVEAMSGMEQILRRDPAQVYPAMEFATRDRYRHAVERMARHGTRSEEDVAIRAIELSARHVSTNGTARKNHVGYYLIDKGLAELEASVGVRIPAWQRAIRGIRRLPLRLYVGLIVILAALTTLLVLDLTWVAGVAPWQLALLTLITALCASQLAVAIVNLLITWTVPPRLLPRMNFTGGIPASCRTMVVVPTMLSSDQAVQTLLEDLEVRFLANHDRNLHFALLTDFPDSTQESVPTDAPRLKALADGILALAGKYRSERDDIFFLFHRPRRWNPRERKWMGYERKRGKLEEFNALLRGGPSDRFSQIIGNSSILPSIRFVITLDTDTELPRDSGRLLVATMAHPLVRPVLDSRTGRVCEGYGILQPRMAVSLPSAGRSWFVKLFAGEPGLDPYTRVVSDVYQDLFQEGSFIGKGIYEVDAFQKSVEGRFPENRILSHDLIEGCHARAGLVSDILLYEDHPSHYAADVRRRHRWIRGDWQIATWLLPRVPGPDARRIQNTLSGLSRWKILDNLRRSLVPCALLILLLLSWGGVAGGFSGTLVVLGILLAPVFLAALVDVSHKPPDLTWLQNTRNIFPGIIRQLAQVGFTLLFLPYDVIVSIDAIVRTISRMWITRRSLLEWETSSESERRFSNSIFSFFRTMGAAPLLALSILAAFQYLRPQALSIAAPFIALWILSPLIAWWISQPLVPEVAELTSLQHELLRRMARRTWRFFEDFVSPEDHFLPPDNFQEYPARITAHRTSPTNIGCSLLANLAAWDFGYLPAGQVIDRIRSTLGTMESMSRHHGHFYNWYDTLTLEPLAPLYVSSVDSGNLAGMLLTLQQGLLELRDAPLLPPRAFAGLADTLLILKDAATRSSSAKPWRSQPAATRVEGLLELLSHAPGTLSSCELLLRRLTQESSLLQQALAPDPNEDARWAAAAFDRQARALHEELMNLAPWTNLAPPGEHLRRPANSGQETTLEQVRNTLRDLETTASNNVVASLNRSLLPLVDALVEAEPDSTGEMARWLIRLREFLVQGSARALGRIQELESLAEQCGNFAQMDFQFLFDKSRDQIAIGFNVTDRRRDPSFYDLLASEARLGSFVAIAQDQLPQEHWFALGRRLTFTGGHPALLSWSGSMFEYLMPLMIMPTFDGTLLDQTYRAVVRRQIDYGNLHNVPWGISESGYNTTDAQMNYQYRAFGVPGLGYKRGLADDLVIAPYATVMALMIAPEEAAANLERLEAEGFTGAHGFYEAVDYTPARLPGGQSFAIIRSFMAHHQGMSLLSLAYTMLDRPMQRRFMADPRLRANALLLHERVPKTAPTYPQSGEMHETQRLSEAAEVPVRTFTSPQTPVPEVHLLSNGHYHVMVSNAGSGSSKWNDLAVTRWRVDPTRDCWGSYCYIRDLDSGEFWSATYQPTVRKPERYEAHFPPGRAEFRRLDDDIDTRTDVAVSPEADVELRRIIITNRSGRRRRIELTSYAEVVLAPPAADLAHPAFSNLFVQTEILQAQQAILCARRPRSEGERPPFLIHLSTVQGTTEGEPAYETDRAKFLGRGRGPAAPAVMESNAPLSGSQGAVLDPIVAIRRVLILDKDESARIDYVTGVAETRDAALALISKHRDPRLGDRVFEMAWTHSQIVLRHLNATEADAQVFGRLLGSIVHPNRLRRADPAIMARNRRGQSGLWSYGISGDLPIVMVRIGDQDRMELVRQVVQAHAYWRMKGLAVDLVIWNEDHSGYRQALNDQIVGLIAAGPEAHLIDRPGGIFIRRLEQITEEDRILFLTSAHAILSDSAGTLAEQVARKPRPGPSIPTLEITAPPPPDAILNPPSSSLPHSP